jgi:hypothetical protein
MVKIVVLKTVKRNKLFTEQSFNEIVPLRVRRATLYFPLQMLSSKCDSYVTVTPLKFSEKWRISANRKTRQSMSRTA